MAWTNKRFETVSFCRQPDLSRSMVQWAQAWVDCISTNQRVVKRPRGCRMVCWRSGRNAPNQMVQRCVCRFILFYSVSGRSVAELDQGSRRRLFFLQWHETYVSTKEIIRLQERSALPVRQALASTNHGYFPALAVRPHLGRPLRNPHCIFRCARVTDAALGIFVPLILILIPQPRYLASAYFLLHFQETPNKLCSSRGI